MRKNLKLHSTNTCKEKRKKCRGSTKWVKYDIFHCVACFNGRSMSVGCKQITELEPRRTALSHSCPSQKEEEASCKNGECGFNSSAMPNKKITVRMFDRLDTTQFAHTHTQAVICFPLICAVTLREAFYSWFSAEPFKDCRRLTLAHSSN